MMIAHLAFIVIPSHALQDTLHLTCHIEFFPASEPIAEWVFKVWHSKVKKVLLHAEMESHAMHHASIPDRSPGQGQPEPSSELLIFFKKICKVSDWG